MRIIEFKESWIEDNRMKRSGTVLQRNKSRKRAKRVYSLSNDEEPDYTGWTKVNSY